MATKERFVISTAEAGVRLDKLLARRFELSRAEADRWIADGRVVIPGEKLKSSLKLGEGTEVIVILPDTEAVTLEPPDVDVPILYEDAELLVVNKPRGLLVHPGIGQPDKTLVQAVEAHLGYLPPCGEPGREGIVHRLDQETTGALIVAKTKAAFDALKAQFMARTADREYLALVRGTPPAAAGSINYAIGRDTTDPTRFKTGFSRNAREAETEFRVERSVGDYHLMRLFLITGRTHQIRVHLDAIGLNILGDDKYGKAAAKLAPFLALHAARLAFDHPASKQRVSLEAPLPQDFARFLRELGDADV